MFDYTAHKAEALMLFLQKKTKNTLVFSSSQTLQWTISDDAQSEKCTNAESLFQMALLVHTTQIW